VWVSIGFKELEPYFSALRTAKLDENELETIKKSCIEAIKIQIFGAADQVDPEQALDWPCGREDDASPLLTRYQQCR